MRHLYWLPHHHNGSHHHFSLSLPSLHLLLLWESLQQQRCTLYIKWHPKILNGFCIVLRPAEVFSCPPTYYRCFIFYSKKRHTTSTQSPNSQAVAKTSLFARSLVLTNCLKLEAPTVVRSKLVWALGKRMKKQTKTITPKKTWEAALHETMERFPPREAMSFRIVVNHVRAANSDEDADSKLPPPHREPGEHFSKFTKIDAKHER